MQGDSTAVRHLHKLVTVHLCLEWQWFEKTKIKIVRVVRLQPKVARQTFLNCILNKDYYSYISKQTKIFYILCLLKSHLYNSYHLNDLKYTFLFIYINGTVKESLSVKCRSMLLRSMCTQKE